MLFSAIQCLLIELNAGMYTGFKSRPNVLADLATSSNEIAVLTKHYSVPADLREQLELLVEVRHEIIHPSHRPGAEKNSTPAYLRPLRDAGLLQTAGVAADYLWLAQLLSHRLFRWVFETIAAVVDLLLVAHNVPQFAADGLRQSYTDYARGDDA